MPPLCRRRLSAAARTQPLGRRRWDDDARTPLPGRRYLGAAAPTPSVPPLERGRSGAAPRAPPPRERGSPTRRRRSDGAAAQGCARTPRCSGAASSAPLAGRRPAAQGARALARASLHWRRGRRRIHAPPRHVRVVAPSALGGRRVQAQRLVRCQCVYVYVCVCGPRLGRARAQQQHGARHYCVGYKGAKAASCRRPAVDGHPRVTARRRLLEGGYSKAANR